MAESNNWITPGNSWHYYTYIFWSTFNVKPQQPFLLLSGLMCISVLTVARDWYLNSFTEFQLSDFWGTAKKKKAVNFHLGINAISSSCSTINKYKVWSDRVMQLKLYWRNDTFKCRNVIVEPVKKFMYFFASLGVYRSAQNSECNVL